MKLLKRINILLRLILATDRPAVSVSALCGRSASGDMNSIALLASAVMRLPVRRAAGVANRWYSGGSFSSHRQSFSEEGRLDRSGGMGWAQKNAPYGLFLEE